MNNSLLFDFTVDKEGETVFITRIHDEHERPGKCIGRFTQEKVGT